MGEKRAKGGSGGSKKGGLAPFPGGVPGKMKNRDFSYGFSRKKTRKLPKSYSEKGGVWGKNGGFWMIWGVRGQIWGVLVIFDRF